MEDLHNIGGVPAVMKYCLEARLGYMAIVLLLPVKPLLRTWLMCLHLDFDHKKLYVPVKQPLKATGHLQILYGNIATRGSVAKISGKEGKHFEGPARVFDGEFELIDGISSGRVNRVMWWLSATWAQKVHRVCPKCLNQPQPYLAQV